jgi:sigma-B regulation protein RsbU (phosphoserine phosphatase)
MATRERENDITAVRRENQRLQRAVEELSILNKIAVAINSSIPLEKILETIISQCTHYLKVEQAAILLVDETAKGKPMHTMIRGWGTGARSLPFRLDTQLLGWMLKKKEPLLVNDFKNSRFYRHTSDQSDPVRSLLSVPLFCRNRVIGLLTVFNKKGGAGFSTDDRRLLAIIGSQSAQAIENARLLKEEQEFVKMRQELRIAYDIQTNLLPHKPPNVRGYDIFGDSVAAKVVGGDYFDYFPIDRDRVVFCLGDVSGKGIPAALLMSHLQATVRSQSFTEAGVSVCVDYCNRMFFHNSPVGSFCSFFMGVLDIKRHHLTYVNAGHNYPFFCSGGRTGCRLCAGDMVLGVLESVNYKEFHLDFAPGDRLVVFSDGITEAMNQDEMEFSDARLGELIAHYKDLGPRELVRTIIRSVREYTGDRPLTDDMTLLVIRRNGESPQSKIS